MNEALQKNLQKNNDFLTIYNKSYRLVAAIFTVSNLMGQDEELKTKIKKLSLELVSKSVSLKDINFSDAVKLIGDLEKISLELMSMLDIASITGLISKMNGDIIKEEFQSFVLELGKFLEKIENSKKVLVKGSFLESSGLNPYVDVSGGAKQLNPDRGLSQNYNYNKYSNNGNREHKRKDMRKSAILDFVKEHKNVSIKDIVPNIVGCSEKTVQRELIALIADKKIVKTGERRWSRYSPL